GQEELVFVPGVDALDDFRLTRPEAHRKRLAREQVGQGGAPAAGAQDRDAHHADDGLARRPNRFSVPARSRRILARCSQMMASATRIWIQMMSRCSGCSSHAAMGRTAAPIMLPSETYP